MPDVPSRLPLSPARLREYLQTEIDSHFLYQTLATLESNADAVRVYEHLAASELRHAQHWRHLLQKHRVARIPEQPSRRAKILAWLARRFGAGMVLPTLAEAEQAMGSLSHKGLASAAEIAGNAHGTLLRTMQKVSDRGMQGGVIARFEGRHHSVGGNALRAAVLGANDGLVSNMSLVMGVAGASSGNTPVLIAGVAGLLAGAISMALGEWLSVQSARELYQRQVAIEAEELALAPEEEAQELSLIYQTKGLSEQEADALASRLLSDPDTGLATLAAEELGINIEDLGGSAWEAALASFALFSIGAVIPVLPFFLWQGADAVLASFAASSVGLFGIGAAITLLTGRSLWFSGARQVLFGLSAAAVTYGIGHWLGASLIG